MLATMNQLLWRKTTSLPQAKATQPTTNGEFPTIQFIVLYYSIKKQNKHIQLSTKKKENRFSTKGPFKGLRVKWQALYL